MRREGLLDLNEAVQNPGKTLEFDVSTELADEADVDLLEPVTGQIMAVSTGNALLIHSEFRTKCVVECARCAAPLEVELAYTMDDDFPVEGIPSGYHSEGHAKIVSEEPFQLFDKNALVKDTYVRQGLILNMPVQPLCSFGWDGPCPNDVAAEAAEEKPGHGHPGMMALEKFRGEVKD